MERDTDSEPIGSHSKRISAENTGMFTNLLRKFLAFKNRNFVAIGALCFFGVILFKGSQWGYVVENRIARSLEFKVRSQLNMDPKLDPRVKVFAFDSSTVSGLSEDDLELEEWGQVLLNLDARRPKIILIDKVFATPRGLKKLSEFKMSMANITTPIVVDSYTQAQNFMKQNLVAKENEHFDLEKILKKDQGNSQSLSELTWLPVESSMIVGPLSLIQSDFKRFGLANVQKFGYVKPLARVDQRWAVPHWSFFAADSIEVNREGLAVNHVPVSMDSQGLIIPNLLSLGDVHARSQQFLSIVYRSLHDMPLDSIEKDDVVIILPAMFPGNKDWIETPRGSEPGGYIMTALVNSVLTGNWLHFAGGETTFLMFTCFLGVFLVLRLSPVRLLFVLGAAALVLIAVGLYGFCQNGIVIPWFYPVAGLVLSGTFTFAENARVTELRLVTLRASLKGKLSIQRIENIAKNPSLLKAAPTGRTVSIMFIDIVGFSQLSERQTPEEAFLELKKLFELLRTIVLKKQGIVDKTLGDGMLCYFGYGPDGGESSRDHADQALACAIEIQKAVLAKNLTAAALHRVIYPLRIGINTSSVFLGNIGDANHFDFTMIGNGVNLAKRLESACQHYAVMIGSSTYDLLMERERITGGLTKRLIPIKHSDTPLEAFECDPFYGDDKLVQEVSEAYRKSLGIDRKDPRWPVPSGTYITMASRFGSARVFNFSNSGFSVVLEKYIGSSVQVEFTIEIPPSDLQKDLVGTVVIVGEIRWGKPLESGYLHGILIKNLSDKQKVHFVNALRAMIQSAAA